jgi:hypothetical protein
MTIHDATEVAYKNGYAAGKRDALKWIPVTERLPSDGEKVLAFSSYDGTELTYQSVLRFHSCLEAFDDFAFYGRKHGGFVDYDSEYGCLERSSVTHWMPLPTPPKEDA